jgi:hypothetical protein
MLDTRLLGEKSTSSPNELFGEPSVSIGRPFCLILGSDEVSNIKVNDFRSCCHYALSSPSELERHLLHKMGYFKLNCIVYCTAA